MLKSATIRFKLDSHATQEQLLRIEKEITSYFEQIPLKPEKIICRKGSVEVIIIFGAGVLLYVGDKVLGGALEEIGKIFLSWIRDKFSRSSPSDMPLDGQKLEILESEVKQVTQQSTEGLTIFSESSQRSEADMAYIFQLFDSLLKSDGEAELIVTKGIDGSSSVQTQGIKVKKFNGKITEISEFKSYKIDE